MLFEQKRNIKKKKEQIKSMDKYEEKEKPVYPFFVYFGIGDDCS